MKNTKLLAILMTVATVPVVSAYYDTYGTWHDDIITESVEATK